MEVEVADSDEEEVVEVEAADAVKVNTFLSNSDLISILESMCRIGGQKGSVWSG